jgi:branched-chain amino acid aminotransferase
MINHETNKLELPTVQHRKKHPPMPVVLSEDLRDNPEGTFRALCKAMNIDFKPEMLKWKAGPRPEIDGCWAPWWYKTTHESTCFAPPRQEKPPPPPLSEDLQALVDECMPYYQFLKSHAMKPDVIERRGEDDGRNDAATTSQTLTRTHAGTHAYAADPRNDSVLIGMRDGVTDTFSLVPRKDAKVSVFDSGFVLGDGVWEGIRLHDGVLMYVDEHVKRLYQGAKAIDMEIGVTQAGLIKMMYETVDANQMKSGVHIRLMVTRGLKSTPYQNPTFTVGKPTIVIAAEHKAAAEAPKVRGMRLMTTHVRRGAPDVQDPAWNSHSKLNCIAACIQANKAGVDESLMLDPHGFVATCNSVHFFIVVDGVVLTSRRKYILHGITRDNVMRIANGIGLEVREDDFTLTAVYSAEECFVTGTFAGVLPVREVDGRQIGDGKRGPVVKRLQEAYVREVNAVASRGRRRA